MRNGIAGEIWLQCFKYAITWHVTGALKMHDGNSDCERKKNIKRKSDRYNMRKKSTNLWRKRSVVGVDMKLYSVWWTETEFAWWRSVLTAAGACVLELLRELDAFTARHCDIASRVRLEPQCVMSSRSMPSWWEPGTYRDLGLVPVTRIDASRWNLIRSSVYVCLLLS